MSLDSSPHLVRKGSLQIQVGLAERLIGILLRIPFPRPAFPRPATLHNLLCQDPVSGQTQVPLTHHRPYFALCRAETAARHHDVTSAGWLCRWLRANVSISFLARTGSCAGTPLFIHQSRADGGKMRGNYLERSDIYTVGRVWNHNELPGLSFPP
jgi:hypothetical protein